MTHVACIYKEKTYELFLLKIKGQKYSCVLYFFMRGNISTHI